MLKIYYLERKSEFPASQHDYLAKVVMADSAGAARAIAQDHSVQEFADTEAAQEIWLKHSASTCKQVGIAAGTERYAVVGRLILASRKEV